jgi:anti-sigma factor RsiW
MRCEEAREMLPAHVGDPQDSLAVRRHLAGCDACRAEAERYLTLRRAMTGLGTQVIEPPVGLLASLQEIPTRGGRVQSARTHVARNKKAYVGGAVLVAGAAGAALWRSRRAA